jgi:glycerol-3-phosphate dehydrogenase subunit B
LESPVRQAQLASALKKIVHSGERIGLPALLGVNEHANVWAALQNQTGAPIFEIPTLPPSVPGIRLYRALRQQLNDAGGRIETNMEAIGFHADGNQIRWVETATSARPIKHYARHFLLATGGLLGGGFNSDHTGRCWETLFDLPLTITQDRNAWFHHQFLHPQGQPVFTGGVAVNSEFQPMDNAGEVIYNNLSVAGSALAHTDPIRERSLEGIAISTGIAASKAIVL